MDEATTGIKNTMNITSGVPTPTQYRPTKPEDFFGPARKIADQIKASANQCLKTGDPSAFLFYGAPGVSKSELARFTMRSFGVDMKWNMTKMTGLDMSVDFIRDMSQKIQMTSMCDGYRGFWFDEIDTMKRDAQVRYLTMYDDLPKNVVIAATCNSDIGELEPRFTRRFQAFEILGPTADEITGLFSLWLPENEAKRLAHMASIDPQTGMANPKRRLNVGAVLADLKTLVERRAMAS